MKTLKNFSFKNKRVLVRCDFNVSFDKEGNILDDFRIKESIPTIKYLLKKKAKIILMSHLGEPEVGRMFNLSLDKVHKRLMEYLDFPIIKASDCVGSEVEEHTKEMAGGEILLLENLRFHKEEKENDIGFAESLARLGDIYINDAFGVLHRSHASVVRLPKFLPSGIGFLVEKEIKNLNKLLKNPKKPMIVIIGGKKVETKIKFLDRILRITDFLLIGGIIKREIEKKGINLKFSGKVVGPLDSAYPPEKEFDIGPKTINLFREKIIKGKTIFWNGPLGLIENENFQRGTLEVAKAIIDNKNIFSVAGGGETVGFLNKMNLASKFTHISTGGGAMLHFLSGKKMPGLEVLK